MSPTPPDMDSRNQIDDVDHEISGGGRNNEEEVMPRVSEQSDRPTSRNSTPRSFKQPAISTLSGKYNTNKHNENSNNVTPKFERQNRLVGMNLTPNLGLSMTPSTSLFVQQQARREAIQSLTTSKELEQRNRRRSLWSRNNSLEKELLRTEKDKLETAAALHRRKEEDLKRSMVKELQERKERENELMKSIELLKEIHHARKTKEQDLQDQIVDLQEIVNELSIQNQSPEWTKVSNKSNTKQSNSSRQDPNPLVSSNPFNSLSNYSFGVSPEFGRKLEFTDELECDKVAENTKPPVTIGIDIEAHQRLGCCDNKNNNVKSKQTPNSPPNGPTVCPNCIRYPCQCQQQQPQICFSC